MSRDAPCRLPQYLCSLKYGINLLMVAEFAPPVTDGWNITYREEAAALLAVDGVDPSRWWTSMVVLLGIVVGFRLVAIVALSRRANKAA